MHTELNRRDMLKAAGGTGLGAGFGAKALDLLGLLGEDAQAATTCLLTPEVTEGPTGSTTGSAAGTSPRARLARRSSSASPC